jgi:8-oxo-dGTP diphosphatase
MTTKPKPILHAVDVVVQRKQGGKILFIRRKNAPFKDKLALPGGFVEPQELLIEAASRELQEETGIIAPAANLRLIGTFDQPDRDPRRRVIATAYVLHVPNNMRAIAGDDAESVVWMKPAQAFDEELAFDHREILANAIDDELVELA